MLAREWGWLRDENGVEEVKDDRERKGKSV